METEAPSAPPAVDKHGFLIVKPKKAKSDGKPDYGTVPKPKSKAGFTETGDEDLSADLNRLVKILRRGKVIDRVQAARELGAMGPAAAPAARAMCDVLASAQDGVAREVLAALEQVRPELHGPVALLVLDANLNNRTEGASKLARLGPEGNAATGLVLDRLAAGRAAGNGVPREYLDALYDAARSIAPEDAQAVAFFKQWAGPGFAGQTQRWLGLNYLTKYAGEDLTRRKEIAALVMAGIADDYVRNLCVSVAGDYGAICKPVLPIIIRLKQHSDRGTRETAIIAAGKIEAAGD